MLTLLQISLKVYVKEQKIYNSPSFILDKQVAKKYVTKHTLSTSPTSFIYIYTFNDSIQPSPIIKTTQKEMPSTPMKSKMRTLIGEKTPFTPYSRPMSTPSSITQKFKSPHVSLKKAFKSPFTPSTPTTLSLSKQILFLEDAIRTHTLVKTHLESVIHIQSFS